MGTLSSGTLFWEILLGPSKEQYEIHCRVVYPQTEKWNCLPISLSSIHQGLPYGFLTTVYFQVCIYANAKKEHNIIVHSFQ